MDDFTVYNEAIDELPIVVDIPHSGTEIPLAVQKELIPGILLPNVDWFLQDLYDFVPQQGFTTLENNLHRYLADPNRNAKMTKLDGDYRHEVVYSRTTFGKPIYHNELSETEIQGRIDSFYKPYHDKLQQLLNHKLEKFEKVYLLDLHSFAEYPHEENVQAADVVLGNKTDTTSDMKLREFLTARFEEKGYTVSNNHPFSGGYITQHYGQNPRIEAIQIELAYHMYIENRYFGEEELSGVNVGTFTTAKNSLQSIFLSLFDYVN
ncbi:N-formylglutamate amidohydrolase [Companilactobacillus kimchiensis]|uniref:N-formylglutamate amidohydrolase n=1 Tax=Companilactobacillus kimchiensis TaxID=993692 RepID=A0A0R2LJE6_9LACO|nr:N-formylglutamate amidohydrolase [Companilactobacillus kimchiensis]KRN98749.1 N-formylglutamate amidohydrolase [Companilactobacillus kimchiensis]